LPAPVNSNELDSIFVKSFGFPAVAIFYFILLFTQCTLVIKYIGSRTEVSKLQVGLQFGIAFALIYILGIQELGIDSSPFSSWGFEYVKYQFIMGIGDAVPVLLLCLATALFTLRDREKFKPIEKLNKAKYL
jgi:hypothetical protein